MNPARTHHWTYTDYLRLPDDGPRYEILDGMRVEAPAPLTRHQIVLSNLHIILGSFVRGRKLGRVLEAPCDVVLAEDTVLQPDLLFISSPRSSIIKKRGVFGGPDLVVEILSRHSFKRDTGHKLDLYSFHGIREYWIVDPDSDRIEVFLLEGDRLVRRAEHASGEVRSLAAISGFSAPLAEIFERPAS